MNGKIFAIFIFFSGLVGCAVAPDYPKEPVIEFVAFSKYELVQGRALNDSLYMDLTFTDGDGDIGSETDINLRLIDRRTGNNYDLFRVPKVPEAGASNGISGTMRIKIYNTCCLQPDGEQVCEDVTVPSNELAFDIILTDRAGNESNRLMTPTLSLRCN